MSDIGADAAAAKEMVEAAEDKLIARNNGNELVAYLFIHDDKERNDAWQKQLRRFSRDPTAEGPVVGVMETTYAMSHYLLALEVALGERKAPEEPIALETLVADGCVTPRRYYDDEIP